MQRLHFIIFLLFIFISFMGLNPSPQLDNSLKFISEADSNDFKTKSESVINEWNENTTMALKKECGSCHQSSLNKEEMTALKIFDLDQSGWSEMLESETLRSISQRASTDLFSEREIADIKNFVDYKLAIKTP